eukprot:m.112637 g.112637  ORF g.112637 m.112637 type:complete len:74 (+) comp15983_c1_seq1:322-543(+)
MEGQEGGTVTLERRDFDTLMAAVEKFASDLNRASRLASVAVDNLAIMAETQTALSQSVLPTQAGFAAAGKHRL